MQKMYLRLSSIKDIFKNTKKKTEQIIIYALKFF